MALAWKASAVTRTRVRIPVPPPLGGIMKRLLIGIIAAAILIASTISIADYNSCVQNCYRAYAGNPGAIQACIARCR